MSDQRVTVQCRGLTKKYGDHTALDKVDLTLRAGEFVALLGPNGAGKSTLIKLLDGVIACTAGSLRLGSEGDAAASAGVIHQDLGLFDDMSVAENLFLGPGMSKPFLSLSSEYRSAEEMLEFVGLSAVDPRTLLRDLSLGQRALIATARLWSRGAEVIVVDEVTASLPRAEAFWLIEHLKGAARKGATVVMVTHRLEEVVGHVDRYVVFVDGKVALDEGGHVERDALVEVMSSGRNKALTTHQSGGGEPRGEVVVELTDVSVNRIGPLSLTLHEGSITGLYGSSVSGFHDAAYLVAGVIRPRHGRVKVRPGTKVTCLPAHRDVDGTFPDQTVEFNMSMGNSNRWRRLGLINLAKMRDEISAAAVELNVIPRNTDAVITTLSGGNQQKALLGRVVADQPGCVVLCEPTRGVDVATRREIYSFVTKLAQDGCAVMVASSDMEDLASLADRIVVIDDDGQVESVIDADGIEEFCSLRTALG
ncbi:ATP-binding cassette domain-containing protein [Nocardioides immobilis]|uniref:ATP-binding cassette domain-containing protein n=1 Tax=Nocardioides immobilis TaxID=2049295 RepID=UPI0015FCF1BC|nr:ATP-binding cassette domain-containing protein [Nocardioides immobilis]